jgi:UDP-GlcNAc:undecaprenyl-phosphate GlcNAc-1-phosphate transferase
VALAVALALMPVAMALGRRFGWVVIPRLFDRGGQPIPFVGGKALAISALAAFFLVWGLPAGTGSFIAGAVALLVLGVWDDRSKEWIFANPRSRLLLQITVAAAAFWSGFGSDTGGWLGGVGTVAFLLAAMNAFNLLDNMDGVAGSTGAAIAAAIAVVAILGGQFMVASMAAAICGACLGFLRYNLRNARVYLGNGGSLFLGFLLAGLALKLRPPVEFPWSIVILPALFAVPAVDTAVVILSRAMNGRRVTQGGVDHVSHRLVHMRLSKLSAALIHAAASLVSGAMVVLAVAQGIPQVIPAVLALFAILGLSLLRLDIYSPAPLNSAEAAGG